MKKIDVTGIILAKDEERQISEAIRSLSFCSTVIVANDGSTDGTVAAAEEAGATVINLPDESSFEQKRMKAMVSAPTEWVLFLDADERISPELGEEIVKVWSGHDNTTVGYYLRRRDYFWGRELRYGETLKARNAGICRLMHKKEGRWLGAVHETWAPNGGTVRLGNFIEHYPHQTVKEFVRDINDYSSRRARELYDKKIKSHGYDLILYPLFKFILTYILYLGFLDGPAGFAYSFFMSFHSYLVRAKLFQYKNMKTVPV